MRKSISRIIIITLTCILVIEILQMIIFFPAMEKSKKQLQEGNELKIIYANNDYLSEFDKKLSSYEGEIYRKGSVISDLSKENISSGRVFIENVSLMPARIIIDGQEEVISKSETINKILPNTVEIKVVEGAVIIYN